MDDGSPVFLRRLDPARNVARWYEAELACDLFGRAVVRRAWGRIGHLGRVRLDEHQNVEEALRQLAALIAAKRRRGIGNSGRSVTAYGLRFTANRDDSSHQPGSECAACRR